MTNEEARQWFLKVYSEIKGKGYADENEEAYELAIKALEQEPCDDAISREATLEPYKGLNEEDTISVWLIRKNIEQQPSVKPQPICEEREKGECPYYAE